MNFSRVAAGRRAVEAIGVVEAGHRSTKVLLTERTFWSSRSPSSQLSHILKLVGAVETAKMFILRPEKSD